jgi:hypothetical protein
MIEYVRKGETFMKAIAITPEKSSLEIVDKKWCLQELQEAVGGMIENVAIATGITVYADEEALYKPQHFAFEIKGVTNGLIFGNAVVLRFDKNTGKSLSIIPEDVYTVMQNITFYSVEV